MAKSFRYGGRFAVVRSVEVRELVHPTAGEERFRRTRRVASLHGQREQVAHFDTRAFAQNGAHPARDGVVRGPHQGRVLGRAGEFPVQSRDDFEVRDQRPQFRRRTQFQSRAEVQVERPLEIVDLDANEVSSGRSLVQDEAVLDRRRVFLAKETLPIQSG